MRTLISVVFLASLAPSVALGEEEDLPSIAVMDIRAGEGVSADVAGFITSTVARSAADSEAFSVITGEDIRAMLSLEAQKQLCGADSDSCLAEIGGALGADYMISGKIVRIGEATSLSLSLLNVAEAKAENRVDRKLTGGDVSLFDVVPAATIELLSKVLEGRQGTLVVSVSEAGATVKIDGRIVGSSPLRPQKLTAGLHLLEVEKRGFIVGQEEVKVRADQTTARSIGLVPSPDFLEDYRSSASKMRLGAYLSAGLLAAAGGAGIFFNTQAGETYDDFQRDKARYLTNDGPTLTDLQVLASEGKSQQSRAYVSFGVASAAAVSALYFWIAGEDPGRYSHFQLAAMPAPGGGLVSASLRF